MSLKNKLYIAMVCLLIGIAVSIQFKSVQANYLLGLDPSKRSNQLIEEIDKLKLDKKNLTDEIKDVQERLDKITQSEASSNSLVADLKSQIERYKGLAGYTDLIGEGIVIEMQKEVNSENSSYSVEEEFQFLLMIVNELNAAGSEAISINSQRIIASSEIRSAGDNIMINSTKQNSPFVIRSIGNPEVLYSALNQRFGVLNIIRERGYLINIESNSSINIPKYTDVINWQYAKPIAE